MNRTTAAALVTLAVIGTVGGSVSAVIRGDGGVRPPVASADSDVPETTANVLYAGAKVIHDGRAAVRYDAPFDTPDRLVRTPTGYLVSHDTSPQEPSSRVYFVAPDGTTTKVADILGRFDLDARGDRIVATDLETGNLRVWDLDGTVTATWDGGPTSQSRPVWSGDQVLSSAVAGSRQGDSGTWQMWRWDPRTGNARQLSTPGMAELSASRDGGLLAGSVGLDGFSVIEQNYCLGVASAPGASASLTWDTCDWRLNGGHSDSFSPDGKRILTVPSETDGFGPGQFVTFSATAGPSEDLRKFRAPAWTMDANWLDDDTLLLTGATDGDLDAQTGTWIRSCTLEGRCAEVATRAHGPLVVGEQG